MVARPKKSGEQKREGKGANPSSQWGGVTECRDPWDRVARRRLLGDDDGDQARWERPGFYDRLKSLVSDDDRMARLLAAEKRRRWVDKDRLVFIGMHNVADYWWCAMRSVLHSRAAETGFFRAYVENAFYYGFLSGNREFDSDTFDLDESFADDDWVLEQAAQQIPLAVVEECAREATQDDGGQLNTTDFRYVENAEIPHWEPQNFRFRWHFQWQHYVVVGVPDGITATTVYEAKSTHSEYMTRFTRPVAWVQANLYGLFFERPRKRITLYVTGTGEKTTWEDDVDTVEADDTLCRFMRVDVDGWEPPRPARWKCRKCDFARICHLRQA